ncbi:MAG TPA: DNA gyrase inhibitor YacG [Polyangia bacterium]|nr:DNA gyrase inhibitor YacG [Polyangia bacterium]
MRAKCPTCGGPLAESAEVAQFRPFCSERCRLVDLGKWLDGGFRIESPISEEDLDQGLPTDGEPTQ